MSANATQKLACLFPDFQLNPPAGAKPFSRSGNVRITSSDESVVPPILSGPVRVCELVPRDSSEYIIIQNISVRGYVVSADSSFNNVTFEELQRDSFTGKVSWNGFLGGNPIIDAQANYRANNIFSSDVAPDSKINQNDEMVDYSVNFGQPAIIVASARFHLEFKMVQPKHGVNSIDNDIFIKAVVSGYRFALR